MSFRDMFDGLGGRNEKLIYFDNAATSQRPARVVEALRESSLWCNGNIHRAVHSLSACATDRYEKSRDKAASFLNASSREEIIFTSGTTAAINLVSYSFCERFVGPSDEIIVGQAEHHSNLVPWQMAAQRCGAKVVWLHTDGDGRYDSSTLESLITDRTRLVCLAHASNVLGMLNPVAEYVRICHRHNVPILIDGAQGAVHTPVDVQALGCDFYTFSAHKLYGPTGVGVLYGKKCWLEQMPPFMCGGEMVGTVSLEHTDFAPLPMKFEAGTQNFNAVAALAPALEIAEASFRDKELCDEFENTCSWLYDALLNFDSLHLWGSCGEKYTREKLPVFSFTIDGVHHEDVAILLDKMGVALRSGQMCAEPLMTRLGVSGILRASLLPYNSLDECRRFVDCLHRAVKMLR